MAVTDRHGSDTLAMASSTILDAARSDVRRTRESRRRRRLLTLAVGLAAVGLATWAFLAYVGVPHVDPFLLTVIVFFVVMAGSAVAAPVLAGRSPHVTYRPEQIDVGMDDVVGLGPVREEVVRTLNLFLAHRQFADRMGGTPRRGVLFEGPPGTGKTHMAKAMARDAGVPFLFVSGTAFQSMWYGASARKIRSYFRTLRRTALAEGGAIGFIEEIDAIAGARSGLATASATAGAPWAAFPAGTAGGAGAGSVGDGVLHACGGLEGLPMAAAGAHPAGGLLGARSVMAEGTGGVVNELLVQMQSFAAPTGSGRLWGWLADRVNLLLPPERRIRHRTPAVPNVLIIAATNRADALDPALLRPGRFDRRLAFEAPPKAARAELVRYFLGRKAHDPELAQDERVDALAAVTTCYTPVMIENLFDEALVNAVRRGADGMSWADLEHARLTTEVGIGSPVAYTTYEHRLIATHEAGHATVAWLVAPQRRLEILTTVKRRGALGLLAHGDAEDVFTRSREELTALIQIAMAGQAAEQLFFGTVSTGPGSDLAYATGVAAQMVGACGMAGPLVSFGAVQGGALTDTGLVGRVLADETARAEVERILLDARAEAGRLLEAHRGHVQALRDALLDGHELIGHEITDLLRGAGPRAA